MLNITYLLGAGASANALPTIRETENMPALSRAFEIMADKLSTLSSEDLGSSQKEHLNKLKDDLHWIAKGTEEFGTPDTFAKFLAIKNSKERQRLTNTLAAFFLFEQVYFQKRDRRALIFLTTILQRNSLFPENVKILNWNYDFQIQLAAEVFREERFVSQGSGYVHSPPLFEYYPPTGNDWNESMEKFSLIHLNGIAGFYFNVGFRQFKSFFEKKEERSINHILSVLTNDVFKGGNLIDFAWNYNSASAKSVAYAKMIAEKTDILVVIGYSFPFFNREIDKEIFNAAVAGKRLTTIYYQDPFKSGDFLKDQFELPDNVIVKSIREADNYFIPMEL